MSQFCSLDEAFSEPGGAKKTKKPKPVEGFAPGMLPSKPVDPDRQVERPGPAPPAMQGAEATGARLEADAVNIQDFFPLPGNTAAPEEWTKAFTLEGSPALMPPTRYRGPSAIREAVAPAPVQGLPTLWRPAAAEIAAVPSDVQTRLDKLTQQLDMLTTPTPLQSTAELFLFVAIGLLVLLAIDSILRFTVSMVTRKQSGGGGGYRVGRMRYRH
jgi:hypothetical protein